MFWLHVLQLRLVDWLVGRQWRVGLKLFLFLLKILGVDARWVQRGSRRLLAGLKDGRAEAEVLLKQLRATNCLFGLDHLKPVDRVGQLTLDVV